MARRLRLDTLIHDAHSLPFCAEVQIEVVVLRHALDRVGLAGRELRLMKYYLILGILGYVWLMAPREPGLVSKVAGFTLLLGIVLLIVL